MNALVIVRPYNPANPDHYATVLAAADMTPADPIHAARGALRAAGIGWTPAAETDALDYATGPAPMYGVRFAGSGAARRAAAM